MYHLIHDSTGWYVEFVDGRFVKVHRALIASETRAVAVGPFNDVASALRWAHSQLEEPK